MTRKSPQGESVTNDSAVLDGPQIGVEMVVEAPKNLAPSRRREHRIQIGPRLRADVHQRFADYLDAVRRTGYTQSDITEAALLEFMEKYPPERLRALALGEG